MSPERTHLDESTWERLAVGELAADERARALEHVMGCERCRKIYRGLLALKQGAAGFDPGAAAGTAPRRPRVRRGPLFLAASTAVAAAAALALWIGARPPASPPAPPVRRGATQDGGSVHRAIVVEGPRGAVAAPPATFSWRPVDGADRYRVTLFGADGAPRWTDAWRPADAALAAWPADLLPAPGTYFWRVEAAQGDVVIAESPLVELRLGAR
jgi:hypothetical protein